MTRERSLRIARRLGWVTLGGGFLIALYWVAYFSAFGAVVQEDDLSRAFESAFPIADAVLGTLLFAASRALFTGRRSGPFLLVMAASMCLYLGIVDVTFYYRLGLYSTLTAAGLIELGINALCIGGGATGLRFGWMLWGLR